MIKNYLQFISESIKEKIEEKTLWKLSENDITDYMLEITDAGYMISVSFGFCETIQDIDRESNKTVDRDIYLESVKSGDKVRPAYYIDIIKGKRIINDDVTSTFQFACSIIEEEANAEVSIYVDGFDIGDIDSIEIKSGFFKNQELLDSSYITIFAKSKYTVEFTEEDIVEYYKWSDFIIKEGEVYVEVSLEDMSDIMLSRNPSFYKDILLKGEENMYDHYYNYDYAPDISSMFNYTLNKENSVLLIKAMIKEMGGLEDTINHIGNECSDVAYESIKDKSEEEVIQFLLKERFYETLKQLCTNSEICQEVRQTIGYWSMDAHADSNYKEILDEFDRIVGKEFKYIKEYKEVTKYYTVRDNDGNENRKEYKEMVTYYNIPYTNDWINDRDSDFIHQKSLFSIFQEWCDDQYFTYEMSPNLSDYGDVDSKELNKELKSML